MLNLVPAGIAGLAAGVTDKLVALFTFVIEKICTGSLMAIRVQPTLIRDNAALNSVPAPVTVFPLTAIVPVV